MVVDVERRDDERGFFARTFSRDEFLAAGPEPLVEQMSVSWSRRAGTLRGLHVRTAASPEAKLVRCTRGAVLDVLVDVRPDSPTCLRSFAVELPADNRRAVYVPPPVAHGHQTLVDDCELTYAMSAAHVPEAERGLRYDDPALGLTWPLPVTVLSERDASWPLLDADGRAG